MTACQSSRPRKCVPERRKNEIFPSSYKVSGNISSGQISPFCPNISKAGLAASPLNTSECASAQRSRVAPVRQTYRGAISAIKKCMSNGKSFASRSSRNKFGQNQ